MVQGIFYKNFHCKIWSTQLSQVLGGDEDLNPDSDGIRIQLCQSIADL